MPENKGIVDNNNFFLDIGDILFLFTDGVTEAVSVDHKPLDMRGFVKIIQKHIKKEVSIMHENILNDIIY